jgi:2-polyprenyl-3-methyl-5-hydroxy-6-metoxy-1,4-benzoquinol methylase
MFIGGWTAKCLLSNFAWPKIDGDEGRYGSSLLKIEKMLNIRVLDEFTPGMNVLDFGCGLGEETRRWAEKCPNVQFVGIDTRVEAVSRAQEAARKHQNLQFATEVPQGQVFERIVSLDAFEHFVEPEQILRQMKELLAPEGEILVSFGPPWMHPRGSHIPVPILWNQFIFTEKSLLKWRAKYRDDGAETWKEAGLSKMTFGKFKKLVREAGFATKNITAVPIKATKWFHNSLTCEFLTSHVTARLRPHSR